MRSIREKGMEANLLGHGGLHNLVPPPKTLQAALVQSPSVLAVTDQDCSNIRAIWLMCIFPQGAISPTYYCEISGGKDIENVANM